MEKTHNYRMAIISSSEATIESDLRSVQAYMPGNYQAVEMPNNTIAIVGIDVAGWTMHEYVIPRLASGLWWANELKFDYNEVSPWVAS